MGNWDLASAAGDSPSSSIIWRWGGRREEGGATSKLLSIPGTLWENVRRRKEYSETSPSRDFNPLFSCSKAGREKKELGLCWRFFHRDGREMWG